MENTNLNESYLIKDETLNLKKEAAYYVFFWPWFLLITFISISIAFYYLRSTDRIYESTAQIQIKTDSEASAFIMDELNPFGRNWFDVNNYVAVINSRQILSKVVKKLDLQTRIYSVGLIKTPLKFNQDVPFDVQINDLYSD